MSNLQALLERVEKAEGPDRETDGLIATAIGWLPDNLWPAQPKANAPNIPRAVSASGAIYECPRYTVSLDAAVGLVEKMLPGQACALGTMAFRNETRKPWATIWTTSGSPLFNADAATPALALIAALLKALISQSNPERPGVE